MTMVADSEPMITLTIPGASPDLVLDASQRLIEELNTIQGRIASRKAQKNDPGSKGGDWVLVGQIVLAAISAGVAKQIAQVLIAYIKRNPKYSVQVGTIKITKDYASASEVEVINSIAEQLSRAKSK
jgi:hypothetical protein